MFVQPDSAAQVERRDVALFAKGEHFRLWDLLGAFAELGGTRFVVWAPNAHTVSVAGDWNSWYGPSSPLHSQGNGIWAGFVGGVGHGTPYKFEIYDAYGGRYLRADPMARSAENPPASASVVSANNYRWGDSGWMGNRSLAASDRNALRIYEVHLGTWRSDLRSYRAIGEALSTYVVQMGFTHVELRPVMEHAPTGWGSEFFGFFAPAARFGEPDDFRNFVDVLHQSGIGVILDWSPSYFPDEEWAFARFDGADTYETPADSDSLSSTGFAIGTPEVRSFLISSALWWVDEFHVDGLRIDSVSKILHESGPGNTGAQFLRTLNSAVADRYPGVMMIAEESTAWPNVTSSVPRGGLGFTHKWNLGWMNKMVEYFGMPGEQRLHAHDRLTSSLQTAYNERSVLTIPQSEALLGSGSIVTRMYGDEVGQFANLRALLAWMWAFPGAKLVTAGTEFAAVGEGAPDRPLNWELATLPPNKGISDLVRLMNRTATIAESLWELDDERDGFQWLDERNAEQSVAAFMRWSATRSQAVACVANFSWSTVTGYRLGLAWPGSWSILLNTDSTRFWGAGQERATTAMAKPEPWQGQPCSALLTIPPNTVLWIGSGR